MRRVQNQVHDGFQGDLCFERGDDGTGFEQRALFSCNSGYFILFRVAFAGAQAIVSQIVETRIKKLVTSTSLSLSIHGSQCCSNCERNSICLLLLQTLSFELVKSICDEDAAIKKYE